MAAREWASLIAGLALAGAGLAAFAGSSPRAVAAAVSTTSPTVAASSSPAATTTLPEIPAAVAAALVKGGQLEVVDPAASGIPAEVANVLQAYGIILQVPAPAPGAGP